MASPDMQPKPLTASELVGALHFWAEDAREQTAPQWSRLAALLDEAAAFIQRVQDAAKSEESPDA